MSADTPTNDRQTSERERLDDLPKAVLRELRGPDLRVAAIRWRGERNSARSQLKNSRERSARLELALLDARGACRKFKGEIAALRAENEALRTVTDSDLESSCEAAVKALDVDDKWEDVDDVNKKELRISILAALESFIRSKEAHRG